MESEVLGPPWTLISLQVRNSASFDLSISGYHVAEITSRNASLDHCFNSMGSPHEYVKAALAMIVCDYPYISAWMKWNSCSIKLDGEKMLWSQNSELTNVDDQIDLLNLLCDMAELAEKMGSELTGIDGGRN